MSGQTQKKLLQKVPYGVYVVGVKVGDELQGFLASWVSQVSLKPSLVAVGIKKGTRALELVKRAKALSLNFFEAKAKKMVAQYAKVSPICCCTAEEGKTGAPMLSDAFGSLEAKVKKVVDMGGDHAFVVAEVKGAKLRKDAKLLNILDTAWRYGG